MSKSYYLIRHKDNTLQGPMLYRRLVKAMVNQQVDLSAEISGDLGPWVFLNRGDELKLHYPQLYEVMKQNELLAQDHNWLAKLKEMLVG